MYALTNGIIYTRNKIIKDYAVVISENFIKDICPIHKLSKNIKKYDLLGLILSPGFIDLQINGCGGIQFNDELASLSVNTLKKMQLTNLQFGCTSFLPTLITSSDSLIRQAIKTMRTFLLHNKHQALGLHLEGPFLNPIKKGTHNPHLIRYPNKEIIDYLCSNNDVITKITLAPEQLDSSVIMQLQKSGILISIGHSNATYQQTKIGFDSGINFGTHLFNSMPPLIAREPGVIGAIFDTPDIYCSIIADGIHVHWANIKYAKKIKTNHLILITDATSPAGTNNISHFTFSGKTIYHNNNICIDDQNILSGSTLTMIEAIKNSVIYASISLEEAIRMATLYPAQAIGLDHILGSIEKNKIANLTIFDQEFQIKKTIVNGKICYNYDP